MSSPGFFFSRFPILAATLIFLFVCSVADAQTHRYLFRQRPVASQANSNVADEGEVDDTIKSTIPDQITITLPGRADILVDRRHHERRGGENMVWRGGPQLDSKSDVTLTFHNGLLFGHVQRGSESFSIRPGRNGRTVIEKINPNSFAPEWGHDHTTHGREMVPPVSGAGTDQGSTITGTAPTTAAAGATVDITLMSVYTPQARAAAGGTTQIQGQIQAAVDRANTAFINSQMIARYVLAHTAEAAYNDSGSIQADLNWVTGNATVASLRNTHAADMVSMITENGGAYCGIGWVQRNPGSGFANYAYQVTARGCLTNNTLAHEHGHNLGMEHDPLNAGITSAGASYPWSFGHFVNGTFRTIMSYAGACTVACPRVLHYSNPDVLYNGIPTGIADQRDNAHTGDLTAPIVANFRTGASTTPVTPPANNPPTFVTNPIVKSNATQSQPYSATLAGSASDPNGDPLTYSKSFGPVWLSVAANGALSGMPGATNLGTNSFTVNVNDGNGGSATATLQINVVAPVVVTALAAPSALTAASTVTRRIDLRWTDNSTNETGFSIDRSRDGSNFSQIATVGANVTTFADSNRRSGRRYYYRVRAYNATQNSAYSNSANVVAR